MDKQINQKLSILSKKWNSLNDTQRWKALTDKENDAFSGFKVNLDNDDTFLTIIKPTNEFQEEYILQFDEFIGWTDGVQTLLKALNINTEPV